MQRKRRSTRGKIYLQLLCHMQLTTIAKQAHYAQGYQSHIQERIQGW